MLARFPQFLNRINHHDKLLKRIDTKSKILLSNIKTFQILAHIIHNLLTLLCLLFNGPNFGDDLLGQGLRFFYFLSDFDIHHCMLVDLVD